MQTKLISLKAYCPKAKGLPLDREDMIRQQVQIEDWINDDRKPAKIPKMEFPKRKTWSISSLHAFVMSMLP